MSTKSSEFARIRKQREAQGLGPCAAHPRSRISKEREDGMGMDTGDEGCLLCGEVWWLGSRASEPLDTDA